MKQTAVDWLAEQFDSIVELYPSQFEKINNAIEQAKEIEKEQSLNFAKHCLDKAKDLDVRTAFFNVEQYYNETFNTKEK